MSPEYVRPYVKAHKNDERDAEAIAEAATRPTMRFVELKSAEQLDMQTLHRVRDRLVSERTALINQLRAVLLERGFIAPKGRRKLEQALVVLLEEECGDGARGVTLSPRIRALVEDLRTEWAELDRRIAAYDDEFASRVKVDEAARRLTTIPGIGVLNATALGVAENKRARSAWPRRHRRRCAFWPTWASVCVSRRHQLRPPPIAGVCGRRCRRWYPAPRRSGCRSRTRRPQRRRSSAECVPSGVGGPEPCPFGSAY